MRKSWWLALVALVLVPLAVWAEDQAIGVSAVVWRVQQTLSGTGACIVEENGSSECLLFPADDGNATIPYIATVTGEGICCWVGEPTLDIDANGEVIDVSGPNGSGPGACFDVGDTAPNRTDQVVRRSMMSHASGYRAGLCPTAITQYGVQMYAPCSAGSCAAAYGGGTCVTSPTNAQVSRAGMFLVCEGTAVEVQVTRIPPPFRQ